MTFLTPTTKKKWIYKNIYGQGQHITGTLQQTKVKKVDIGPVYTSQIGRQMSDLYQNQKVRLVFSLHKSQKGRHDLSSYHSQQVFTQKVATFSRVIPLCKKCGQQFQSSLRDQKLYRMDAHLHCREYATDYTIHEFIICQ